MIRLKYLFFIFLAGCATQKVHRDSQSNKNAMSLYEGKLAVILPQKTHQLSFSFYTHPNQSDGRLELRAILGISAATLWMSDSEYLLLNHIKKESYSGDTTSVGFQSWINIDISPSLFFLSLMKKRF